MWTVSSSAYSNHFKHMKLKVWPFTNTRLTRKPESNQITFFMIELSYFQM